MLRINDTLAGGRRRGILTGKKGKKQEGNEEKEGLIHGVNVTKKSPREGAFFVRSSRQHAAYEVISEAFIPEPRWPVESLTPTISTNTFVPAAGTAPNTAI